MRLRLSRDVDDDDASFRQLAGDQVKLEAFSLRVRYTLKSGAQTVVAARLMEKLYSRASHYFWRAPLKAKPETTVELRKSISARAHLSLTLQDFRTFTPTIL